MLQSDFQILNGYQSGAAYRRELIHTTDVVQPHVWHDFELDMGRTVMIQKLKVNSDGLFKCFVHHTRGEFDDNPYVFRAYTKRNGTKIWSDSGMTQDSMGTVWGNRRYSLLSNVDENVGRILYWSVRNDTDDAKKITLDLQWLVLE